MNRPDSSLDEKGVSQNGDPGGHLTPLTHTHTAAATPKPTLLSALKKDAEVKKVFLAGKEYYSEEGKTFELRLVGKIKQQLSTDPTLRPEYPSSLGLEEFTRRATEVALGKSSRAILENRVLGVQTPGFTAAVRLGAELLKHWYNVNAAWCGPVYLSSPCDDSLASIFQAAGIQDIREYYYWDDKQRCICLEKIVEDLERAPEKSVVVLSASAHYPTGADLSPNQWSAITQLIKRRRLFPFFLLPAQAFCSGDLERDAWPVQYCTSQGLELLCAQSFSHCFGLYGSPRVQKSPYYKLKLQGEVQRIVERCLLIRAILREKLRLLGTPGRWDHLTQQGGLFSCIGLNGQQVEFLLNSRHMYLLSSGCLNVSAINGGNVDYIAQSIHLALTTSL
ncbi:putative aspartate aminotransferase, cytoplasmic 2 [Brachyistius frenatus]|uniref:putative aspartate aminotransferase, cytoplasmic 2 n=1 Tax=Brachyistius frenatus TaxID=100188 RepID=UPI0037E8EFE7